MGGGLVVIVARIDDLDFVPCPRICTTFPAGVLSERYRCRGPEV